MQKHMRALTRTHIYIVGTFFFLCGEVNNDGECVSDFITTIIWKAKSPLERVDSFKQQ